MCAIDNILQGVNEIILIPQSDVFLLELEFYGYQSYTCLTSVDINKGITSLGEEIEETVHLKMGNETFYSIEHFQSSISNSSHLLTAFYLSYSMYLISPNCFHSQAPFTITFTPGKAVELIFVQDFIEIYSFSLNISLPVLCVDVIGFVVECTGNLTILYSSFNFTTVQLFWNNLEFSSCSNFSFSYHYLEVEFAGQLFEANFQIIQCFAEFLIVDTCDLNDCSHQLMFDKSCTLLKPYVSLITQHQFLNSSDNLPISKLMIASADDQVFVAVDNDVLEIISYPLQ
ncbi:hypothetical protein GEMRC1_008193 [Eukaryota sp. GEM-RC1]